MDAKERNNNKNNKRGRRMKQARTEY